MLWHEEQTMRCPRGSGNVARDGSLAAGDFHSDFVDRGVAGHVEGFHIRVAERDVDGALRRCDRS